MPDLLARPERDLRRGDGRLPGLRALLRRLDEGLWVHEAPLRFIVEMGRRMVVVELEGGDLFVHSPADPTPEVRAELDRLGNVRFVVAPSRIHGYAWLRDFARAYPDAEVFAPPGPRRTRRGVTFAGQLGDTPDPRWAARVDQAVFRGHRFVEEAVFLHRPSRSLIVGDIVWNIPPDAPLDSRLWAWGLRLRRSVGPPPPFRAAVGDRPAARASIDRILAWDFERVVVGHGDVIEHGGKEALRRGYEWIPSPPA